jgi:hypothetical protein
MGFFINHPALGDKPWPEANARMAAIFAQPGVPKLEPLKAKGRCHEMGICVADGDISWGYVMG